MTETTTLTLSLELKEGLDAREALRRGLAGHRAGEVGRRVAAFYFADAVERGAHQELGYGSRNQLARQGLRMAASTLRQYVRVGRALKELPEIDRMFFEDELNWSQVRALIRVAVPETQTAWGEWARGKTVEEVERQVSRREKGQLPTDPSLRRIPPRWPCARPTS